MKTTIDWGTVAVLCSIAGFLIASSTRALRRATSNAILLTKISDAVLGDNTPENPSLKKQLGDMRLELSGLGAGVQAVRADQAHHGERLAAVEGDGRAARAAIRTLQHQLAHVFHRLQEPAPQLPPDPFD